MAWRARTHDAIRIRRARATDIGPLYELAGRCSPETLYRRFHGAAEHAMRRELERVAAPTPLHRSWVAVVDGETGPDGPGQAIHGTATLAWGVGGVVEAAFLVEDAWFRRGLGRRLFLTLRAEAGTSDLDAVRATIQPDNRRAVRFVTALAPRARLAFVDGLLEATIPVATPPGRHLAPAAAAIPAR